MEDLRRDGRLERQRKAGYGPLLKRQQIDICEGERQRGRTLQRGKPGLRRERANYISVYSRGIKRKNSTKIKVTNFQE